MLFVGVFLIAAAVASAYVAFNGVPVGRVPAARINNISVHEQPSALTRVADAVTGGVERILSRRGWRPFAARELELAGIAMPVASLVVMITSLAVVAFSLGIVLVSPIIAVLLALAVPLVAKFWLNWKGARQRKKFAAQLPQSLQMMAASLRAGHSLPRVLDAVSKELDAPMGDELARVVNENRLGRDLVESLENVAERMQSQDFTWVAGAISAQRETGGNLNEILDQVSGTIRDRHHVRMQVMSLSAEGRLSAVILMGLPVCIGVYYTLVASETMTLFVGTASGKLLLLGSAVMYVIGGFWMRSIVNIEF